MAAASACGLTQRGLATLGCRPVPPGGPAVNTYNGRDMGPGPVAAHWSFPGEAPVDPQQGGSLQCLTYPSPSSNDRYDRQFTGGREFLSTDLQQPVPSERAQFKFQMNIGACGASNPQRTQWCHTITLLRDTCPEHQSYIYSSCAVLRQLRQQHQVQRPLPSSCALAACRRDSPAGRCRRLGGVLPASGASSACMMHDAPWHGSEWVHAVEHWQRGARRHAGLPASSNSPASRA